MSGIYIHIPFCRQKCHYCNFFSQVSLKRKDELLQAMAKEIELQKFYLKGDRVNTIYFGGGTPSLLTVAEINRLLIDVRSCFEVEPDAEITMEANPDDLNLDKLLQLRQAGINRLSIGIQSFDDKDLKFLNRVHSATQAFDSISAARKAGFEDISIDLIYGIPTLDNESWQRNLTMAIELEIPHISAYALTVEEKTPLAVMIRKGKLPDVDENKQEDHFNLLVTALENSGYLHYEISNFCKPGNIAQHNTSYWKGTSYLGIGPSAHSYNGVSRQWNISDLDKYIIELHKNKVPYEQEILTAVQRFNEYVMVSLRTQWGCDLSWIRNNFGRKWSEQFQTIAAKYLETGLMKREGELFLLTKEGKFKADGIAADLFITE